MFDWQAELAPPIPSPRTLSQAPPSQSIVRSSLAVTVSDQNVTPLPKSFVAVLGGTSSSAVDDTPLPTPCLKGDTLSIKIGQDEYTKGLADCQYALRGRITLSKGNKPYTARDLATKLGKIWKMVHEWKLVPLGRGFYDFFFQNSTDLTRIWAAGSVSLQPGLLRLSQWTKDFHHDTQKQTHASLWIRLVALPQEYWRERTLKEIASAVGTPISIDATTCKRVFGHYARILVDIDLSKKIFDEILVEREGFAFKAEVQYERRPFFCHHCYAIGHDVTTCKWLHPDMSKENRGKSKVAAGPKNVSQQPRGDKGASFSSQYVPVVKQVSATEVMHKVTEGTAAIDVRDNIPQGTLPKQIPVLELVTLDKHNEEHTTEEEGLEVTVQPINSSPLVSNVGTAAENIENVENFDAQEEIVSPVHNITPSFEEASATDLVDTEIEMAAEQTTDYQVTISPHTDTAGSTMATSSANVDTDSANVDTDVNLIDSAPHDVVPIVQHETHPSKNIQSGLELWARIREYDQRTAAEGFTQVLSKKQQQAMKKQVLEKPHYKTRSKGGDPPTAQ